MGIQINSPKMIILTNDRTDTYLNRIREEINPAVCYFLLLFFLVFIFLVFIFTILLEVDSIFEFQLDLVVALFPTSRDDRYSAVKTLLTAQAAVPSQMINFRTISNATKLKSVTQKIALQINCKMGGELWAVNIPTKTMMVCGVDVYHDPTRRGQSVVGFVASINPALTRWCSRAKYQTPGIELVDTLKICFMETLQKYYEVSTCVTLTSFHLVSSNLFIFLLFYFIFS